MVSTLSVIAQKGGSGKTTLAVALAVAHVRAGGSAVVVDLDPQGSAMVWGRLRDDDTPTVVAAHAPRLARVIEATRSAGADLVVVDTAPREASGAAEAARCADLVLIPSRPAAMDLATIPTTQTAIGHTAAAVVLNACPPRGTWTTEASDAVHELGASRCPVAIGHRVAHVRAFTAGRTAQETEPTSLAATEIAALYRWIMETIT